MTSREIRLARSLVELADTLVDDFDVVELLQRLVENSVDLLDASQAALLLRDQQGGIRLVASTSESARLLELFQVQGDEGPCLDCIRSGAPVLVPDLAGAAPRWPRFVRTAIGQGFRSSHTVPLRLRTEIIGALGLFHTTVGPLKADDIRAAQALADIATIGILQQRTIALKEVLSEQLQTALISRVVIEQAKGVLAATAGIDVEAAFDHLRAYCRPRNLPLTATASAVVRGTLDPEVVVRG